MTGRVDGKMSFVTGAAQGLGEAIAYMLAKEGSKVVLADINDCLLYTSPSPRD